MIVGCRPTEEQSQPFAYAHVAYRSYDLAAPIAHAFEPTVKPAEVARMLIVTPNIGLKNARTRCWLALLRPRAPTRKDSLP